MEKTVKQVYDEYCNLLYMLLLSNCPVDTGNMITHIRMDNDGTTCKIVIDTIPYNKAPQALKIRKKKYGPASIKREVEYAGYTEYNEGKNKNKSWVRRRCILAGAEAVADKVRCEIDV